jgi:hypothetical protein
MSSLGVTPEDLVPDAYVDLLERSHRTGAP